MLSPGGMPGTGGDTGVPVGTRYQEMGSPGRVRDIRGAVESRERGC